MPITNEFLMHIGHLVVCFEELDLFVSGMIWQFLGTDQRRAQIVTAELSFRGKVQLMSALAQEVLKEASTLDLVLRIGARALDAEAVRNRIIHSTWTGSNTTAASRIKLTAKARGFKAQFEDMSAARLAQLTAEIQAVTGDLAALSVELLARQAT